jgi:hypothetical protein
MDRLCRLLLIAAVLLTGFSAVVFAIRYPALAVFAGSLLVIARVRIRRPTSDLHGTARWCSEREAREGGLL